MTTAKKSPTHTKVRAMAGTIGAVCVAASLAFPAPAHASARPLPHPPSSSHHSIDLQFTARSVQGAFLHLAPGPAPSLGDEMIVSADVYQRNTKIGRFDAVLTATRIQTRSTRVIESAQIVGTLTLPHGQLTLQGFQSDLQRQTMPISITGGHGIYRRAGGGGTLTKINQNTGVAVLHLFKLRT